MPTEIDHDREEELKAFDKAKTGTKGLADSGIQTIPKIFIRPYEEILENTSIDGAKLAIPVIDLGGINNNDNSRKKIVNEIKNATEKWGFFQIVNHGIPLEVLDETLDGVRRFHELNAEAKKEFYSTDSKQVVYTGNYELDKTKAVDWRDSLHINKTSIDRIDPQWIPQTCRDAILDHNKHVLNLGNVVLELLLEALGLKPEKLKELECDKGWVTSYHYYPPCPQPELALGILKHTDGTFLTVLLQDQVGGLQVLHQNQWVDVNPVPGALIINIGDLFQILSNDKFKSVCHRVRSKLVGPRISAAFFFTGLTTSPKMYGPIKELVSEKDPAIYREFTLGEFVRNFFTRNPEEPSYKPFMIKYD